MAFFAPGPFVAFSEYMNFKNNSEKKSIKIIISKNPFQISDFGWLDQPFPSAEENCLTWSITITNRRRGTVSEGKKYLPFLKSF